GAGALLFTRIVMARLGCAPSANRAAGHDSASKPGTTGAPIFIAASSARFARWRRRSVSVGATSMPERSFLNWMEGRMKISPELAPTKAPTASGHSFTHADPMLVGLQPLSDWPTLVPRNERQDPHAPPRSIRDVRSRPSGGRTTQGWGAEE